MSSETTEKSAALEFLAWLEVNKKRVIIVAAVILVVGTAVATYRWHVADRELAANTALLKAQRTLERTTAKQAPSPDAFLRVAVDYPGTGAAGRARLLAAEAYFVAGKYTEARQQFETFLREAGGSPFAPTAAYGVAACLDAEAKTNEAVAAYQGVIASYAGSAVASQARWELGGLYEAQHNPAQAFRLYTELAGPGQQSAWSMEAAMRREELLRRHPELAPTNPPALTPLPAPAAGTGLLSGALSNMTGAAPAALR